jgi:hypothetical protein
MDGMTGIECIAAERKRQINTEGFDAEHDSQHDDGELAWAACYYAMPDNLEIEWVDDKRSPKIRLLATLEPDRFFEETGWDYEWEKRREKSRIQQLAVAGALIAAEIDRLQAVGRVK